MDRPYRLLSVGGSRAVEQAGEDHVPAIPTPNYGVQATPYSVRSCLALPKPSFHLGIWITPVFCTRYERGNSAGTTYTETQYTNERRVGGWPRSFCTTDGRASPSVPWLISSHMTVRKKPPTADDAPHHVMRMCTRTKTLCIPSWCTGTSTIVPSRTRGGICTWTVCAVSTMPWP